ncbi:MAG TPA: response regulator transcription factor [Solirubrobacteraceae bacterium]
MRGTVLIAAEWGARVVECAEQLALEGWQVKRTERPQRALEAAPGCDVMLIGTLGEPTAAVRLIRGLRTLPAGERPQIVATADSEPQIIATLAAGADNTVPSEGSPSLLSATVAAAARRSGQPEPAVLRIGAIEVDRAERTATVHGRAVALTRKEMQMLLALAERPRRVVTRDELSRQVWGGPDLRTSRSMDTHMARLNKKLQAAGAGRAVENVWGVGWQLTAGNYDQGVSR